MVRLVFPCIESQQSVVSFSILFSIYQIRQNIFLNKRNNLDFLYEHNHNPYILSYFLIKSNLRLFDRNRYGFRHNFCIELHVPYYRHPFGGCAYSDSNPSGQSLTSFLGWNSTPIDSKARRLA